MTFAAIGALRVKALMVNNDCLFQVVSEGDDDLSSLALIVSKVIYIIEP